MLKKYRKLIFAILAVLLVGLLLWGISFYFPAPRVSKITKEKVRTEYLEQYCGGSMGTYLHHPIIWYDENWYREEENVWRYLGKYGDCYAFLAMDDNKPNMDLTIIDIPFPIRGLARTVYYHYEAYVYLYHTKSGRLAKVWKEWLTDEQLEQLTQDIEKLAKDYN